MREKGFSLIELLIAMGVFVISLVLVSQFFVDQLTMFKQQSKIAETNIEGIVGLEILRRDIEHAGLGLPWSITVWNSLGQVAGVDWPNLTSYSEAVSSGSSPDPASFNDGDPASALPTPANTKRAPRAILNGDNVGINGSDYLVIKSINVANSPAYNTSNKWNDLSSGGVVTVKSPALENVYSKEDGTTDNNVRVIVISPGGKDPTGQKPIRALIVQDSPRVFYAKYSDVTSASSIWPPDNTETRIIYGVDSDTDLRMPFNRADYFISRSNVPTSCAQNTGVLEKAVVNQADGKFTYLPLLDCVADVQVVFGIDSSDPPDNKADCYVNNLLDSVSPLDAPTIRQKVREVRMYVLAQEGQYDRSFKYIAPISPSSIRVGESASGSLPACAGAALFGRDFNFTTNNITNWQNYRWKVYTLVVELHNLM